jgi:hypothetical protein
VHIWSAPVYYLLRRPIVVRRYPGSPAPGRV